jgi:aspartyl protease family protein
MLRLFVLCVFLLHTMAAMAQQPSVKVLGLFNNKALLLIDGERKLLTKGDSFRDVTLVSATGRGAVVRYKQGGEHKLSLNQSIQHGFRPASKSKLTLYANKTGMFQMSGRINGKPTSFLLDTGATYVALSEYEADRLGILYENGRKSLIQTASHVVPAWNIQLDRVKVGDISVSHVEAVVLQGNSPQPALLGMSFLKHVKLERNGASMVLEQRY